MAAVARSVFRETLFAIMSRIAPMEAMRGTAVRKWHLLCVIFVCFAADWLSNFEYIAKFKIAGGESQIWAYVPHAQGVKYAILSNFKHRFSARSAV